MELWVDKDRCKYIFYHFHGHFSNEYLQPCQQTKKTTTNKLQEKKTVKINL